MLEGMHALTGERSQPNISIDRRTPKWYLRELVEADFDINMLRNVDAICICLLLGSLPCSDADHADLCSTASVRASCGPASRGGSTVIG